MREAERSFASDGRRKCGRRLPYLSGGVQRALTLFVGVGLNRRRGPKTGPRRLKLIEAGALLVGVLMLGSFGSVATALAAGVPSRSSEPLSAASLLVHPFISPDPGAPVTGTPSEVKADSAVFNGTVAPAKKETVAWFFDYDAGPLCTGGLSTGVEGPSEAEDQAVSSQVEGLSAGTEYTVCLVSESEGEQTLGNEVSFTTAVPPQTPQTSSPAQSVTATTATLEGVLNPAAAAEVGFHFLYSTESSCASGASETTPEPVEARAAKARVSAAVTGLEPHKHYLFCLVAVNGAGESAQSANEVSYQTPAAAPEVIGESASGIRADEAHLEGTVNANNEATECRFEYGSASVTEHEAACEPELFSGYGEQAVTAVISGLTAKTPYRYRLVAESEQSRSEGKPAAGPEKSFETPTPPETPVTEEPPTAVSGTEATLHGVLNPNAAGEAGSWEFRYSTGEGNCDGDKSAPEPAGSAAGKEGETVQTTIAGLTPGTIYTFCLVAHNAAGEEAQGNSVIFETSTEPPAIVGESVSEVEAEKATLEAEIVPDGLETEYWFEYGTSEAYDQRTEAVSIGSTSTTQSVRQRITGLSAGTTYHYRVVAVNEKSPGGVDGQDEVFATPSTSTAAETCPNAQRRVEQPYALELPECRAYEMVSPANTEGQDATDSKLANEAEASVSGEALTYGSVGVFAGAEGATVENQYISRRSSNGWSTQAVTPLHNPLHLGTSVASYLGLFFTPELTEGIANTTAQLTPEAPALHHNLETYLARLGAKPSYRYISELQSVDGASTDLSHVAFGDGKALEWINGTVVPLGVSSSGELLSASAGGVTNSYSYFEEKDTFQAVSDGGSQVYFTSPGFEDPEPTSEGDFEMPSRQLYLRLHAEQQQSAVSTPEANATGSLVDGSTTVRRVAPERWKEAKVNLVAGSDEVEVSGNGTTVYAGQPVIGPGIPAGTVLVEDERIITEGENHRHIWKLSKAITASGEEVHIEVVRPYAFTVGQQITGYGIAPGTTVTGVSGETLTLSAPADVTAAEAPLTAGGECTEATKACTIDVSSSERATSDPHSAKQSARFWGASADGSRMFFTSDAELTEDAYTGAEDNAANLYEFDMEKPEGQRLTDLSVDTADPEGAAVQGVSQISENGAYVYFVADGKLATGAIAGQPNLYVVKGGGAPKLIATLAEKDETDWANESNYGSDTAASPMNSTAVVSPSGEYFAFISERSLTGYDNEQSEPAECEASIGRVAGDNETGRCREVYLYDAASGKLACASCNPSDARPLGSSSLDEIQALPYADHRARNVLDDGTLFFQSRDEIVPHASDGLQNVYEYQDGHVDAVSNVAGGHESFFLDASPDGRNVFFATAEQLLPEDTSGNVEVYDARVDGGFSVSVAPPACDNGDSCKPPPAAQPSVFGAPASETFSGPGDLTSSTSSHSGKAKTGKLTKKQKLARALQRCRKRPKRSRAKCKRVARERYGAKHRSRGAKRGRPGKPGNSSTTKGSGDR